MGLDPIGFESLIELVIVGVVRIDDYRFSANLQGNLNYSGRLQGKGKVINTLTAEARAYF